MTPGPAAIQAINAALLLQRRPQVSDRDAQLLRQALQVLAREWDGALLAHATWVQVAESHPSTWQIGWSARHGQSHCSAGRRWPQKKHHRVDGAAGIR